MVNRLNNCTSNLTATGTSSCTEFLSHSGRARNNNELCQCPCYFINDHTYTILKKICRRMIKDYNRCQCREKYTIFDGGNSINVRIHRSASRGDRGDNMCVEKYHRCQTEDRTRHGNCQTGKIFEPDDDKSYRRNGPGKHRKSNDIDDKSNRRKGQRDQNIEERERGDEDKGNTVNVKTNKRGGKNEYNEDYNRIKSKTKANGYKNSESINYDNDENYSRKRYKANAKKITGGKSKGRKVDDDNSDDINIVNLDKKRKDLKKPGKNADRDRENNRKSKDHEGGEYVGALARNGRGRGKKGIFKNGDDNEDVKYRKGKKGRSSQDNDEESKEKDQKGRKSKANNGDNSRKKKNREKKGEKSKSFDYSADNEDGENLMRKKVKGGKSRTPTDIGDRIITDLRKSVRKGDKVGLDINRSSAIAPMSQKLRSTKAGRDIQLLKQFAESLQYRQLNSTRADEVRACDYLRANMENREMCQLVCNPQLHSLQPSLCDPYSCIPRPCMTCVCPCPGYNLCSESTCKC